MKARKRLFVFFAAFCLCFSIGIFHTGASADNSIDQYEITNDNTESEDYDDVEETDESNDISNYDISPQSDKDKSESEYSKSSVNPSELGDAPTTDTEPDSPKPFKEAGKRFIDTIADLFVSNILTITIVSALLVILIVHRKNKQQSGRKTKPKF